MKVKETPPLCQLCNKKKGNFYVVGLYNYLCNECGDLADKVIYRWNAYLLTLPVEELARQLIRVAETEEVKAKEALNANQQSNVKEEIKEAK